MEHKGNWENEVNIWLYYMFSILMQNLKNIPK